MFLRFLDEFSTVFPFKNSQGYYYMATEKVHGIIHTPNDIPCFCHYLNSCCETLTPCCQGGIHVYFTYMSYFTYDVYVT